MNYVLIKIAECIETIYEAVPSYLQHQFDNYSAWLEWLEDNNIQRQDDLDKVRKQIKKTKKDLANDKYSMKKALEKMRSNIMQKIGELQEELDEAMDNVAQEDANSIDIVTSDDEDPMETFKDFL